MLLCTGHGYYFCTCADLLPRNIEAVEEIAGEEDVSNEIETIEKEHVSSFMLFSDVGGQC